MPKPKITGREVLALLVIIIVLDSVARSHNYYWGLWWYDIPMHLLGGVWVALTLLWLEQKNRLPFRLNLVRLVLAVVAVGLLWEIYEIVFELTFTRKTGYIVDTISDLLLDLAGGLIVHVHATTHASRQSAS
jgi:VanZ family protein